jgi:ornithine cyclodeaminase/alanine dehydrogenase-like protein (mu-crystallin family)
MHVILVGSYKPDMAEGCAALIRCGQILVDSRSGCAIEASKVIAVGVWPEDVMEVGELLSPGAPTHDERWAWEVDATRVSEPT